MNRNDFKQLAERRIAEANILLDNSYWEGAYYLAGYAVECAIKACIAKQTKRYDFPPDVATIGKIYSHNLEQLIGLAELRNDLTNEQNRNPQFNVYWNTVKDWSEQSRYKTTAEQHAARDLYEAITDRKNGVLKWLKKYW
jgi:HEPN domain-containing protein